MLLAPVLLLLAGVVCVVRGHSHHHQQQEYYDAKTMLEEDDSSTASSSMTIEGRQRAINMHGWNSRRRRRHYHAKSSSSSSFLPNNNNSSSNEWNLTCHFIVQPLNHFDLPRNQSGMYRQRYCVNNEFVQQYLDDDGVQSQQQQDVAIRMDPKTPIFFYTGNESPLEEYINNTGLLWELAREMHAQVVFAEHRYEGASLPSPDIPHCMAYSSSLQALADYATLIETVLWKQPQAAAAATATTTTSSTTHLHRRPVIAFGGSYGGMLSAWMRMKYPNMIAGAIAGSAPIHAFPRSRRPIDGAWQVITQGLQRPYPPNRTITTTDGDQTTTSHCASNLLASWPLMEVLGREETGRELLTQAFSLCQPLTTSADVALLRHWASTPWFDMAEGSFPYPSSYIPFALTHRQDVQLPAWPLQAACWKASNLHADNFGVVFHGNLSAVRYNVTYGKSSSDDDDNNSSTAALLKIAVDWDTATAIMPCGGDNEATATEATSSSSSFCLAEMLRSNSKLGNNILDLLGNVRQAVSVWYNMTQDVKCYDLTPAPNRAIFDQESPASATATTTGSAASNITNDENGESTTARVVVDSLLRDRSSDDKTPENVNNIVREERRLVEMLATGNDVGLLTENGPLSLNNANDSPTARCLRQMELGSWPALCCNEDMNLIMTLGAGLGNDAMWPPSHPRGVTSYTDIVALKNWTVVGPECRDDDGIFGFPQGPIDPWSTWYDIVYGNVPSSINAHSNIISSNGLLDPWSAGGVYADGKWSWDPSHKLPYYKGIPGLYVQNLSSTSSNSEDNMMIAVLMEYGGHHTDLMFRNATHDPPDVAAAREIERDYIQRWIDQFWQHAEEEPAAT
jgi:lysosomal Pro-X carboxypeptidase